MTYSNLMVYASNLNLQSVLAIVISSPFKSYEKTLSALDGPVFDFQRRWKQVPTRDRSDLSW